VREVKAQEQLNSAQNNYKGITKQYVISFYLESKLSWAKDGYLTLDVSYSSIQLLLFPYLNTAGSVVRHFLRTIRFDNTTPKH
jgi:hypothetical protein